MTRKRNRRPRRNIHPQKEMTRTPTVETLERRELFTVGATGAPAAVAAGTGFDGVVQLIVPTGACTGSLLNTGRHVLTAAHCVDSNRDGVVDNGNLSVRFDLPSGAVTHNNIPMSNVVIPASWNGLVTNRRGDIAIITLPELAPSGAQGADRYDLYRNNDEINQVFTVIGYGQTNRADGTAVCTPGNAGVKRLVANRFDSVTRDTLVFDFDRATAADAVANEGNTAPGDSGGPSFINGQIAAVTSGGAPGFSNCRIGDNPYNTRVSTFAGWIDNNTDGAYNLTINMDNQAAGNDGRNDAIIARRNGRNLEILVNGDVYHVDRASNIRSLTINGSADNEVFSLQTTVRSQFNGRGGNDTLMGANVANRWSITGTNQGSLNGTTRFSSMENLKGGAGADRFMFSSSRLASITGTIRGGGGGDWLDYSRRHTSVHVDLRSRQATSVGRVEGIENVKGGQADDVLIGDSQDNMMFGLGGNDFMAGMDGRDRLYGGSDDDILKGTNGRDILDGGTGNNQLVWT